MSFMHVPLAVERWTSGLFLHMADFPSEPCSVNFAKGHTRSTVILFPPFCFSFAQFFPSKYYITYIAKVTTTTEY